MHFMVLKLDTCRYYLPSALSPSISLFVKGSVRELQKNVPPKDIPRLCLSGPHIRPREAESDPGTLALVVLFRPGYLESSLNVAPADIIGRSMDMRDIVGMDRTNAMFLALSRETTVTGWLNIFQQFLLSSFHSTGRRMSLAESFMRAHGKIFFPLMELASYFGVGQRQLERRIHTIFGVPLRDVRRLARWGLCLQRLVDSDVRHGDLTRIAQDSGYFDQAHMTREFVELSGMAPLPLLKGRAGDDPAYWAYRIRGKDYQNLFIPVN